MQIKINSKYTKTFKNKKVLITGHTGFKGSWLSLWMYSLGAKVMGVSKDIPTKPSHISLINLENLISSKRIDIQEEIKIKNCIRKFNPDFIFHLAAQAIVKKSYLNSLDTWKTNLLGTINILESLRSMKKKVTVILVTSDKVYKNLEISRGYNENDILGGVDPYGASKSATEIAVNSYIKSFFSNKNNKIRISVARAGNVVGGGDWSPNRLIPDCFNSWLKNKTVKIRNPNSTRPWQHVLDVLNGYIKLSEELNKNKRLHSEAFNFGPTNKNYKVIEILKKSKLFWPQVKWNIIKQKKFFENTLLNLNSSKSRKTLNWKPKLNMSNTVKLTIEWYQYFKKFKDKKNKMLLKSLSQIKFFENIK